MEKAALGLLGLVLAGCAPAVNRATETVQSLLRATATEQDGVIFFQVENISKKTLQVLHGESCLSPTLEVRLMNGSLYMPPPKLDGLGRTVDGVRETCITIGILEFLPPKRNFVLRKSLNLSAGTYKVRAWLNNPLDAPRGPLGAPPITVTIP